MVHVIVVYDVEVSRVNRVNKFLRRYLHWIQNSVFRGDLTESQLEEMKEGLLEIIDVEYDSVTVYVLPSERYLKRVVLGVEKGSTDMIL